MTPRPRAQRPRQFLHFAGNCIRRNMKDERFFFTLFVILIVGIASFAMYKAYTYAAKCTDNGGHWEKYNCHLVTGEDCNLIPLSNGTTIQACTSYIRKVCDEHCIDAFAEESP